MAEAAIPQVTEQSSSTSTVIVQEEVKVKFTIFSVEIN